MNKKAPSKFMNSNTSKSKKSSTRDREKRKLLLNNEPSPSNSNSNSSTERMQLMNVFDDDNRFPGFGPETVQVIAEQFLSEKVSDEVCANLAEDISFKLREIVQSASINMRQCKRKHLKVDDINATFKKYNIERIYGPSQPKWISLDDADDLSYIKEENVDLLEIANSELHLQEPGDIGINYKWLTDTSLFNNLLINNSLNYYSQKIMNAVESNKKALRKMALKNVATNRNIGPIIPHFCNFCFLILQKNITYSSLASPTLQLLEAVMFNPCTSYSIEEKQVTLLIYLLLENIMNATNFMLDEVVPICRTMGRLCMQWQRGCQVVIEKIIKYLSADEPIRRLTAPIIYALCFIGNEALNALLWPHISAIFKCLRQMEVIETLQIKAAILTAASLMYKSGEGDHSVDYLLREEFGDALTPLWRWEKKTTPETELKSEDLPVQTNWFNIKRSLQKSIKIHSQQNISHRSSQYKLYFRKAKPIVCKSISIIGYKELPIKKRILPVLQDPAVGRIGLDNVNVITGRRTLFTLKRVFAVNNQKCNKNISDMMYMI